MISTRDDCSIVKQTILPTCQKIAKNNDRKKHHVSEDNEKKWEELSAKQFIKMKKYTQQKLISEISRTYVFFCVVHYMSNYKLYNNYLLFTWQLKKRACFQRIKKTTTNTRRKYVTRRWRAMCAEKSYDAIKLCNQRIPHTMAIISVIVGCANNVNHFRDWQCSNVISSLRAFNIHIFFFPLTTGNLGEKKTFLSIEFLL